jgi:hypothetical protein
LEQAVKPTQKYVAIWQSEKYYERNFIRRIFEPYIAEHVVDGTHSVVLDNAILIDAFIYSFNPDYYAAFSGKNAFLLQLGDEFYELGVDRYVHFRGVFRTIWASVFNPERVMQLPLGFSLNLEKQPFVPASQRRYAWSFIGEAGKASRPEAVRAMVPLEPHFLFSSTPVSGVKFFSEGRDGKRRIPHKDFADILLQSAFAPAPMGNASLESCRVYDALEAGAIPIVERRLTLDYFGGLLGNYPFPTVRSWGEARRIAQRLLNNPSKLDAMQRSCTDWWSEYQNGLTARIGEFLAHCSAAQDELRPLRSRLPTLSGWQYFELLRHQTLRGLVRRVARQLSRVVKTGKWKIAANKSLRLDAPAQPGNRTERGSDQ